MVALEIKHCQTNICHTEEKLYTCPMHPEVKQNHPGICPKCGMSLESVVVDTIEDTSELDEMNKRFWISLIFALPVFIVAMTNDLAPEYLPDEVTMSGVQWFLFALSTPVVFWGGWPFFVRGWESVITWNLNMFTLISIGVATAWLYSVVALFMPQIFPPLMQTSDGLVHVYFEAAAVITTLVLLGQVLELKARSKTNSAIKTLLSLAPTQAHRIDINGNEENINLQDVQVGDTIRIKPGEKIPVDGIVIDGHSNVDESMITGEPIEVYKSIDDSITGATLNKNGTLLMRAVRVGSDTLLWQIVNMVSEAQRSRAPIQKLADTVSGYFVPAVVISAVLAFFGWYTFGPEPRLAYSVVAAVAVLIIACPCALGLATPISIMVSTGQAALSGILIKDAETLETMEKVNILVVDKTGTLTQGKPKVTSFMVADGVDEIAAVKYAASLEKVSEHPLAESIVKYAKEIGVVLSKVENFNSVTGKGIVGKIDNKNIIIGSEELLNGAGIQTKDLSKEAELLRSRGNSVVFVAINSVFNAVIGIEDPIKSTSLEAIEKLKDENIHLVMISGDNEVTVNNVAEKLGIDEVYANVMPDGKLEIIKKLQKNGSIVAMAGDGINDAPALALADVGIAMGNGTDVAIHSAGVTLIKGDLLAIVKLIKLSRSTMKNIRQNLFFAFIYNSVGVPVAAGLLYPFFGVLLSPVIAAVAMSLSSVSVISNALRLKNVKLN